VAPGKARDNLKAIGQTAMSGLVEYPKFSRRVCFENFYKKVLQIFKL